MGLGFYPPFFFAKNLQKKLIIDPVFARSFLFADIQRGLNVA